MPPEPIQPKFADIHFLKKVTLGASVAWLVFSACAVGFAGVRFLRRQREEEEESKKAVDLEAGKK